MTETTSASLTSLELDQLQQVRALVLAFQNVIATLPAEEQNDARNEQFNRLRLEAKALLKERDFDHKVSKAVTQEGLLSRQRAISPRLLGIVIFGVILALLGLGINSIILEDFVINSLACLVSTGGMALIAGAFMVWLWSNARQRLSNLGELYLGCTAMLEEINRALNQALPGLADQTANGAPQTASIVELSLDSLYKQAADWQNKLRLLEDQQFHGGTVMPLEVKLNLDFVQRELRRVRQEIERLQGTTYPASGVPTPVVVAQTPAGAKIVRPVIDSSVRSESQVYRRAKSSTMDMPVHPPEPEAIPEEDSSPWVRDNLADSADEDTL
ncbi:MAG: hypothetical protein U0401_06500 [Anaerolineae bacterium]